MMPATNCLLQSYKLLVKDSISLLLQESILSILNTFLLLWINHHMINKIMKKIKMNHCSNSNSLSALDQGPLWLEHYTSWHVNNKIKPYYTEAIHINVLILTEMSSIIWTQSKLQWCKHFQNYSITQILAYFRLIVHWPPKQSLNCKCRSTELIQNLEHEK